MKKELVFAPGSMSAFLPEGEYGSAKVVHERPDKFTRLRAAIQGQALNQDVYTRLIVDNTLWMTDADFEWRSNIGPVHKMTGDVLIAGLGIGFIVRPLLVRKDVASITVIEKNTDVLALVGPHLAHKKLVLVQADAYEWSAPKRAFDCCYFDIWPNIPNADDWEDIKALKHRYRPSLRPGGWIAAWCEDRAKR